MQVVLLCTTLLCRQPELCCKDDTKAPEWKVDGTLKRIKESIG